MTEKTHMPLVQAERHFFSNSNLLPIYSYLTRAENNIYLQTPFKIRNQHYEIANQRSITPNLIDSKFPLPVRQVYVFLEGSYRFRSFWRSTMQMLHGNEIHTLHNSILIFL